MHSEAPAGNALAEAEQVIARLVPLTRPIDTASHDLQEHLASAWFRQMETLRALGRHTEVAAAADALAGHFQPAAATPVLPPSADPVRPETADPVAWPWLARALCEKARALAALGSPDAAVAAVQDVQRRFATAQALPLRQWVAAAGLHEAELRAGMGATFARVDMVRRCQALAEHFGLDDWPETQVLVARIRLWRARLLSQLDYDDEALKDFASLHTDLFRCADPRLRELAADAQHAQARLLRDLGRRDEALACLQALVGEIHGEPHPGTRQTLALAQTDLVFWWQGGGDEEGGEGGDPDRRTALLAACDAVAASHADSGDATVLVCVNQALRLKAQALRAQADEEEEDEEADDDAESSAATLRAQADAVTDGQWDRYAGHTDVRVVKEVLDALLGKLSAWNHPAGELAGYQAVLDRFGPGLELQATLLQPLLARTLQLKAWAEGALERPDDALATLDALDRRWHASTDPALRLAVAAGGLERGRILAGAGRDDEALAVLDKLLQGAAVATDKADAAPVRQALARAMDLRADIWQRCTPPAHAEQGGKDASGAPIEVVTTEAERQYAAAVDTLGQRCAADPSAAIRAIAANACYQLAVHQRERLHLAQALASYDRYLQGFAADTTPAIEKLTANALLNKGFLLMMLLDRAADALVVYDTLIARFTHATSTTMRDTLARAAASRLTCLNRMQRQGLTVNYGEQYEDLPLAERDALTATIERGRLLGEKGDHRQAIAVYDGVLARYVESLHPELRRQCLDTMVRKAYSLGQLAQREAALAVNDEAIARYGGELSITFEKDVALAMANRAVQLDRLGRHDEERQTYEAIIARWRSSNVPELRRRVASARFCQAIVLTDTDLERALALYQEVMDDCLHAAEPRLRLEGAKSAANRGFRLRGVGRFSDAVACYEALLAACGADGDEAIAAEVVKARIGLARSYGKAGQPQRQAEAYQALLALPGAALDSGQRSGLHDEYRQLQPASSALGKAAHALGAWIGKRRR